MRYTSSSPGERAEMLEYLGAEDVGELYSDVPDGILLEKLELPDGLSEQMVWGHMSSLAGENETPVSFLGAGYYRHYIPAAVDEIISRSEFYTSYTPYQAEVSQGVLQALFEYQSMMCELTGQEVCNATMYDGSTALAEAAVMAHRINGKERIVVSDTLHPHYIQVLKTYCEAGDLTLEVADSEDGMSQLKADDQTSAVVVQTPNYYGILENVGSYKDVVSIACIVEPTSLGLVKPPKADITVGEGQAFGNPVSYGGPSLGIFASKMKYVRDMPGRLVGETVDEDGRRGFALTLQAREQHIRREKATSNICTSQSLCGIAAAVHLALLGPEGLKRVALRSHLNAVYLMEKLSRIKGFKLRYDKPFYNEFLMDCPDGTADRIRDAGVTPGLEVDGGMLFCTTELQGREDLDRVAEVLR